MVNYEKWFNENVMKDHHVHGRKILGRLNKKDVKDKVIKGYIEWHNKNENLKKYSSQAINKRLTWVKKYKDLVSHQKSTAQSKFVSSILEELMYYVFKDLVEEKNNEFSSEHENLFMGGTKAYSNLYFAAKNVEAFVKNPNMRINVKDQDFAIYRPVTIKFLNETETVNIPVVCIECKTYLDKTMLDGSIAAAEKIKYGNPYCLFVVVCETYQVDFKVDPKYSRIDQIFVLKKDNDSKNDIEFHVLEQLFDFVKSHLGKDWSDIEGRIQKRGEIF